MFWTMVSVVVVVGALITVLPFWRICTKAGFPGPVSPLMLIPLVNIIVLFYIAFAEWPASHVRPPKA